MSNQSEGLWSSYVDPAGEFRFRFPSDWMIIGRLGAEVVLSAPGSEWIQQNETNAESGSGSVDGVGCGQTMNVVRVDLPPGAIALDHYVQSCIEQLPQTVDSFELESVDDARLSPFPAKKLVYTSRYRGIHPVRVEQYVALTPFLAYVVTFVSRPDPDAVHLRELNDIIDSFEVLERGD
jgi:hypothetical protein